MSEQSHQITFIPLNRLGSSRFNARKTNRKADIEALAASISAHGLLQNLSVIPGSQNRFEVVAGRLRYAGFDRAEDLAVFAGAERGAIVEFEPRTPALKPADQAVARIAAETGGLYSPAHHAALEPRADPGLMAANARLDPVELTLLGLDRRGFRSASGACETQAHGFGDEARFRAALRARDAGHLAGEVGFEIGANAG